ncbi:carboxymuconolactone decarboxylase family protein [Hamadaea tsunoensis]|uniref:carboxymuconolactone decarboxylase family protein n=1 Tax=Hamadaea tsunoensis TaxID=53368 RepID=UPI000419A367|nr:carboxymuconolactone decarboxylase family protein [Hamadaea tsunoensis]
MSASDGQMPVLDQVLRMTLDSAERSGLDDRTYLMVRVAALAASDAGPASWMANLGVAAESGVTAEDIQSVLVAVAPVIGTARTVAAAGNALRGIGLAAAAAESMN